MDQAKLQNIKQEIAKTDTTTLQYLEQLLAGNAPAAQNIVRNVLVSRALNPPKKVRSRLENECCWLMLEKKKNAGKKAGERIARNTIVS